MRCFIATICTILFLGCTQDKQFNQEPSIRWRLQVMRDEKGAIPDDARLLAQRSFEANLEYWQNRSRATSPVWTARGPFDRGGRARAFVIHPKDSQILWAAAGSGGLWKSEDRGASWRPIADKLGLPAGCLVIDPKNADVLYFGTGERFHSGGPGAGIFVTHDGGANWKRLTATRSWRYIPSIAISAANSNLILAAVSDPDFPARSGVYRSTNAGQSWKKVLAADAPSKILFQPGNESRVLLAVRNGFFPSGESNVMISDDAGLTWRNSLGIGTHAFTRYEISFSKSQPQIVYAASTEGAYRSTDAGASFTIRSNSIIIGLASWTGMLWVSPTDPDLLFVGGVHLARSRDGGATWKKLDYFNDQRDVGHLDFQFAIEDPGFNGKDNRKLYVLNDGGIDRFDDAIGAKHAVSLDRSMQTIEYFAVAGRASDGLLLGGAQDRGTLHTYIGSNTSTLDYFGDGVCAIIDDKYQYGCAQFLSITRIHPDIIGVSDDLPDANTNFGINTNFAAPVILDPNAPKRMLAGGASLWRSVNVRTATYEIGHRAKWVSIKPRLLLTSRYDDSKFISAIAVAIGDSNEIWIGHNDGELYFTRNGLSAKPEWQTIDNNSDQNPLPDRWPTRILVDASNRRRIFITFGGFTADNLWRSDDGGKSWHSSSGAGAASLPKAPLWSIAQHPQQPSTIVVGSEVGLYVTRDSGKSWSAIRAPFSAAAQNISFLQGSTTLLVGTFGRGLWTVDLD